MKILKNNHSYINILIFNILSVVFLFSVHALSVSGFLFNKIFLIQTLKENYLTVLIGFLSIWTIAKFKKISHYILLLFVALIVAKSFLFLSSSFNKLVLGMNFIYLVFSFYYFTQWELFLKSAFNNANYSINDLEIKARFPIYGQLINDQLEEIKIQLTNLDENGCFVLAENSENLKLNSNYQIKVNYENVLFSSNSICVSTYGRGLGLKFIDEKDDLRSMSGLYKICLERGLFT